MATQFATTYYYKRSSFVARNSRWLWHAAHAHIPIRLTFRISISNGLKTNSESADVKIRHDTTLTFAGSHSIVQFLNEICFFFSSFPSHFRSNPHELRKKKKKKINALSLSPILLWIDLKWKIQLRTAWVRVCNALHCVFVFILL